MHLPCSKFGNRKLQLHKIYTYIYIGSGVATVVCNCFSPWNFQGKICMCTLIEDYIHANRRLLCACYDGITYLTRSDKLRLQFKQSLASHAVCSIDGVEGGLKICFDETYELFSKFPIYV